MASPNPYAMDQNLMLGFSNLSKALLGSAQDDASIAQGNLANTRAERITALQPHEISQLQAQAYANNQLGDKRGAETVGINQKNNRFSDITGNIASIMLSPEIQSIAANNLSITPDQLSEMNEEQRASIVSLMFGELGDASQMSSAFNNIGEGSDQGKARQIILNPKSTRDNLLDAMAINDPTAYASMINSQGDNATDVKKAKIAALAITDSASITGEATENWQNYKANQVLAAAQHEDKLRFDKGGSSDRSAQIAADATVKLGKWKVENENLEIAVEPGEKIVLSPKAGERLGLTADKDGLFVLDGGAKPGSVVVKVGKEDVYLDEATAEALGIPKNGSGQYIIAGNPDAGSGSLSSRNVNYGDTITEEQVSDLLPEAANRIVAAYGDSVPDSVKFGIRDRIISETDKNLANGQDFQTAQSNAFNKLLPMTSVNTSTLGTDAVIPTVTHNLFLGSASIAKQGKTKNGNPYSAENHVAAMTRELKNLGYESAVISKIIEQYPVSKN